MVLNQRAARKLLEENGWAMTRGGKHVVKMTKPGERPITLPHHKNRDYPPGLSQVPGRGVGACAVLVGEAAGVSGRLELGRLLSLFVRESRLI